MEPTEIPSLVNLDQYRLINNPRPHLPSVWTELTCANDGKILRVKESIEDIEKIILNYTQFYSVWSDETNPPISL